MGASASSRGLYNLGQTSFRAAIGKGRASLFVLGGRGKTRVTIAGCNKTMLTVVIPSGGNGCTGIVRKRSDVARIVGDRRPFLDALVNHCKGHVTKNGFVLRKGRCSLAVGGNPGSLRNNPAKFRAHV